MINDDRLEKKEKVIDYLSHFPFYKWAAKSVGRDEDTLLIWRKEDPDFSDRCEMAKSEGVKKFGKRATPDFILKSVDPETFKEGKGMGDINIYGSLTDEQLDKLIESKAKQTRASEIVAGEGKTDEGKPTEVRGATPETTGSDKQQ